MQNQRKLILVLLPIENNRKKWYNNQNIFNETTHVARFVRKSDYGTKLQTCVFYVGL